MLVAFEIVPSSFEYFNNCQQLTIVSLIPNLSRSHLSGENGYQMLLAQIIRGQLTENSTNSITQSICLNSDIIFWIKMI